MRLCIKRQTSELSFTQCCIQHRTQNNTVVEQLCIHATRWTYSRTTPLFLVHQTGPEEGFSHTPSEMNHTSDSDLNHPWNARRLEHSCTNIASSCIRRRGDSDENHSCVCVCVCVQTVSQVGWQVPCLIKVSFPPLWPKTYRALADLCRWNSYIVHINFSD